MALAALREKRWPVKPSVSSSTSEKRNERLALPPGSNRILVRAAVVSFVGYLALLFFVRANPRPKADFNATIKLQRLQNRSLARLMDSVSWFGFRPQSLLVPFTAVALFWFRGRKLASFFLTAAWASSLLSFFTKLVIRRPRPDDPRIRIVEADIRDTSFPSGHTLHYVTFWGFLAYLGATSAHNRRIGRAIAAFGAAVIGLVGPSRVYLGHHWLTDVIASYLLGFAYLTGLVTIYRFLRWFLELDDLRP